MSLHAVIPLALCLLAGFLSLFNGRAMAVAGLGFAAAIAGPWLFQKYSGFEPPALYVGLAVFDVIAVGALLFALREIDPLDLGPRSLVIGAIVCMLVSVMAHFIFATTLVGGVTYTAILSLTAGMAGLAMIGVFGGGVFDRIGVAGDAGERNSSSVARAD